MAETCFRVKSMLYQSIFIFYYSNLFLFNKNIGKIHRNLLKHGR